MVVLAYVLSASSPASRNIKDFNSDCSGARIVFGSRWTEEEDEEHLQRFSRILRDLPREGSFDGLCEKLPFKWFEDEYNDVVNPFGDNRQIQYDSLWTFDTEHDVLRHTNRDGRRQVPFALLREREVHFTEMQLLGGSVPPPPEPTIKPGIPYWEPQVEVDIRARAFIHPLLRDFHHQWRHILRNPYNSATLRSLARAIIRLATLNFQIRENTGGRGPRGVHVWITRLPGWEPFRSNIVQVGNTCVVICQDLQEGLSIVQRRTSSQVFAPAAKSDTSDHSHVQPQYMILSVNHVMLCYATDPQSLRCTAPATLFNGDSIDRPASDLALDYLIWATASARPSILTRLQRLPIEVQDIILTYTSIGSVGAAKIGCMLNIGSPFSWKDGHLMVTLEERYVIRPPGSSVESQIWFDDQQSGIFYLARKS